MARHDFDVSDTQLVPLRLEDPAEQIVHVQEGLRLKRRDASGAWSPTGLFEAGELLLETWRPLAADELTGFWATVYEGGENKARFRLSPDEGLTELYWDGASWVVGTTAAEWNTEREVDDGISSFPFETSLSVILRLESGDGNTSPVFRAFHVFYETLYDPTEDLLRSLFEKVQAELEIPAVDLIPTPNYDVSEVDLGEQPWAASEPVRVYNLTTDPNRTTNLFASLVGTVVSLTAPQQGLLEVRFRGRLRTEQIHISTDGDYQLEVLPAVVIFPFTQSRVRDDLEGAVEEQLRSKGVVRLRVHHARHTYTMRIACVSQFSLHDKKLADGIRRALDSKEYVRSLALDEEFKLVGVELVNQTDQTREQLFTRTVEVLVSVLEWLPGFRDVPMVEAITYRQRVETSSPESSTTE